MVDGPRADHDERAARHQQHVVRRIVMRNSGKITRALIVAVLMAGVLGTKPVKAADGVPGPPGSSPCAWVLGISYHMPDAVAEAFTSMWGAVLGCQF
jgi:hypothetical protein